MKNRRSFTRAIASLFAVLALGSLAGCDLLGLGKDPIEGTWDLVAIYEAGTRTTVTELEVPPEYSQTWEFGETAAVYTIRSLDEFGEPASIQLFATWTKAGETYIITPDDPEVGNATAWMAGSEMRFWEMRNDTDYYAFTKR